MVIRDQRLGNGLRVLLAPLKTTAAVTVLALTKVGSRFEGKPLEGAAHFVEHLMFKGTKKRPTTAHISQELDSIGAEYNAYTGKDHTGYYIKASVNHLELALDMISDMLLNSKFEDQEIKREKGVIIEEINMYEDNPMMHVPNLFEELLYGSSKPLGHNIAGTRGSITKMQRKQLVDFRDFYYQPSNMILGISGGLKNGFALKIAEKYFSKRSKIKGARISRIIKPAQYSKEERMKVKYREGEQIQLALGFPAFTIFDKDYYALHVLNVILGGNMSSRLFSSVRERQGLCYFIRSSVDMYEDAGNIVIQAGLDKARLEDAIKVIIEELRNIKKEGVTSAELKKAKDFIHGKTVLELEDSANIIEELVSSTLFYGKVITPKERLVHIQHVTLEDVKRVAQRVFVGKMMKLALVGPIRDSAKLEKMVYSGIELP